MNTTRLAIARAWWGLAAAWATVTLGVLLSAVPVDAKPGIWQGKNVSIAGIPGCDCTQQDAKECWCTIP